MISIQIQIKRYKLFIIILTAIITIAVLMLLARLPVLAGNHQNSITFEEQNGIYDLTGIESLADTAVTLLPGSSYYPNELLTPESLANAVPESTERYEEIRADYLSQHFLIKMPDTDKAYALTFKLSGRHAMRVYVNGVLVGQS